MSNDPKLYTFRDLIDLAFNEDSVHLKVLQTLLKIIISQLNLDNIKIELQGCDFERSPRHVTDFLEISEIMKDNQKILTVKNTLNEPEEPYKIDPVYNSIPSNDQLIDVMSHKADNPIPDMIQLLNITKRVEALEFTAHKLSSMIDSLLKLDGSSSNANKNQASGIKKCNKKLLTPLGTLGRKKGEKLQEFPCISSFAPCPIKQTESNNLNNSEFIQEFECEIKNQIDSVNNIVSENFFYLQHQMCDMQKKFSVFEEEINDLMFACEINDQILEETMTEIVDFNSNIFCLKSDVKTLLKEESELRSKIEIMEQQIVALELNKAEKEVMERELNLKATVIELEKMIPRSEFTPLWEDFNNRIEQNKFNQERHQETIKIILKQFRTELCDKLEKDELEKFKSLVTTLFDTFVSNLRCLLLRMKKDAVGIAGIKSKSGALGCLTCQSEMVMHQTTETIPRLDSVATKFKVDVNKYPVTHARNWRRFCGGEKTVTKPTERVLIKGNFSTEQESNFLNFPNSQPCFIISTDNLIYKADPIKCLQNLKYRKTET